MRTTDSGMSYLEIQAYMGTTKHMGGFTSTQELIERCHIDAETYLLDVGCGVGSTACYLAATYGCRVVGVDLQEAMVAHARARAQREGVSDRVEFRVADACDLPFVDGMYDVVLCESVATFVEDKQRLANELARVTKTGGWVGLNEEVWLQTPPPPEVVTFARTAWGIEHEVPTTEEWTEMLTQAGLRELDVAAHRIDLRRDASQVKRYRAGDMFGMFWRVLRLYLTSPAFRTWMRQRGRLPKGAFDHIGYVVAVGRR